MWKEKLGNYFIDLSKYMLTAVVVGAFVKDFADSHAVIYIFGIVTALLALVLGIILCSKTSKTN